MEKCLNTLENKSEFFACYYGQKIMTVFPKQSEPVKDRIVSGFLLADPENAFLELYSLEDITDEHLLEALYHGYPLAFSGSCSKGTWKIERKERYIEISHRYNDYFFTFDPKTYDYFEMYKRYDDGDSELQNTFSIISAIDYLRGESYLTISKGLEEEDLLQYGWAKIKKR